MKLTLANLAVVALASQTVAADWFGGNAGKSTLPQCRRRGGTSRSSHRKHHYSPVRVVPFKSDLEHSLTYLSPHSIQQVA